jgi:bifunctional DNA-binding transcriptional regulator/antitoxin component of YhaV-PrlF toxin-antitoxin module
MPEILTVEAEGKVTLPADIRYRYGFAESTPVRVIETQGGVLLIPLTDAPMSEELRAELGEWQALGGEALKMFPYEEGE